MLSKIIALPFIIGTGVAASLAIALDENYAYYIIPQVIFLVVIYLLSPQIDWWWYQKHPPTLEKNLQKMFEQYIPYYRGLSPERQLLFQNRVAMYIIANEFIPKGWETVPEDVKAFIAANAVQLNFGREDYRMPPFERIVVYPTPFPSPQFPEDFHASEVYEEDAVLLFSAEHIMAGTMRVSKSFNVGLYEFAKVLSLKYPDLDYPKVEDEVWTDLEKISGSSKSAVQNFIGLTAIDVLAVCIVFFFNYSQRFAQLLPEIFDQLSEVLNQDPRNVEDPVKQPVDFTNF